MKIAVVAPIEETVPPTRYGGTEWIVYHVANRMGKLGHQVDLYASGDSDTKSHYNLIPLVNKSIRTIPEIKSDPKLRETTKFAAIADSIDLLSKKNYDLIHNHAAWRFLLFSQSLHCPILTTHHGPLSFEYQNIIYKKYKNNPYVSISNNQRKDLPELNFVDTVYNGIDLAIFPYSEEVIGKNQAPMIFLARLSPEKGAIEAAQVSQKTNHPLLVTAKVDTVDKPYFEKFKPYIDDKLISFKGEIGPEERYAYLQQARCLLVPIQWEEPFGLMFTESMACGTPVVTFARGSAPEIIVDGVTGFLVNQSEDLKRGVWITKKTGVEGLCEAVEKIYNMTDEEYRKMRQAARHRVEEKFTVEHMVNGYEQVYKKITNTL